MCEPVSNDLNPWYIGLGEVLLCLGVTEQGFEHLHSWWSHGQLEDLSTVSLAKVFCKLYWTDPLIVVVDHDDDDGGKE